MDSNIFVYLAASFIATIVAFVKVQNTQSFLIEKTNKLEEILGKDKLKMHNLEIKIAKCCER